MATYSVEYLYRLRDQFSQQVKKIAAASKSTQSAVRASGQAANTAAAGYQRMGQTAAVAERQVRGLNKALLATRPARGGVYGFGGGRGDMLGALGTLGMFFGGRSIINQAREASKAENKFRALVDSVTDTQMKALRESIIGQMSYTGEQYADLMDAAADAAQIVGNADLARGIMKSASSLARIDTAGKDTAFFANALASVVGPNGTIEQVVRIADMMAKQQKLGAATAGGTIEAYKNVAAFQTLTGFDTTEMFAAFGVMKNVNSAIKDAEMGTWAQYGVRMFGMPKAPDIKAMKAVGLRPEMFQNALGNFDLKKTHEILYALKQSKDGEAKIKKLFSGRNVQAAKFWGMLLAKSPKEFEEFIQALKDSEGTVWQAVLERAKDLDGAMTRLEGSSRNAAIGFGKWLSPAMIAVSLATSDVLEQIGPALESFDKSYPLLSQIAQYATMAAGGLVALALPLAAIGYLLPLLMKASGLAFLLGGIAKLFRGLAVGMAIGAWEGAAAALGPIIARLGVLRTILLALRNLTMIGIVLTMLGTGWWLVENWDRVKQLLKDPAKVNIIFPEAPEWLQFLMRKTAEGVNWLTTVQKPNFGPAGNPALVGPGVMLGRYAAPTMPMPAPSPNAIPGAMGERIKVESEMRGKIDPLDVKINVPGSISLRLPNGALAGSIPVGASSNAPRGVSAQDAGSVSTITAP